MVSGIDYGLRLIIKTDRPEPIDYFNDVLKISIDIRKELYKCDSNSFVVFELSHLIKRLNDNKDFCIFARTMIGCSFGFSNYCQNLRFKRNENPDAFLYFDVKVYADLIIHKNIEPISPVALIELENKFHKLSRKEGVENYRTDEEENEMGELYYQIKIQSIVSDSEYFQKVKEMHTKITTIELTEDEKGIIDKILLGGYFSPYRCWYEIELISQYY